MHLVGFSELKYDKVEPDFWTVWKCDKIQIRGDDTNKSEWHSWWNQE
jgi:hypothetical protein